MDNLLLRRALYEDPASISPQQLNDDAQLLQLQQELLLLDHQLKQQLEIDVPPQLAEQILLRQQMLPVIRHWWQRPLPYATAAALLLSVWFYQGSTPQVSADLGQHALSHVYHELAALGAISTLDQPSLQPLFAELGLSAELPVPVRYARFCDFEGVRSLHLVLEVDGQPLTVFVVPDQTDFPHARASQFADARFFGQSLKSARHLLVMVAQQPQLLVKAGPLLADSLKFNI